jgi:hypothetical protein
MTIDNLELIVNIENWPFYLKLLLISGIHADTQLMVAPIGFHALQSIISRNEEYDIKWSERYTANRIVATFSLFWNHG